MICIRCEAESPAGYRVCGNCGAALEPTSRRPATMPEREGGERRGKKGERERRYDRRATPQQCIHERKAATHWTRLSCPASGPTRAACCSECSPTTSGICCV